MSLGTISPLLPEPGGILFICGFRRMQDEGSLTPYTVPTKQGILWCCGSKSVFADQQQKETWEDSNKGDSGS